ncbi:MAG: hypothetical protein M0Z30_02610 [Actinomycetota bacterium]|nr:hypothetical protein [Actinomycetota bacterium]
MTAELTPVIAAAAVHQGVILSSALPALGVSAARARRLRAEGWLVPIKPGVLLVGGGIPTEWHQVVGGWLRAGPDGVVSHDTAARIHKLTCVTPPRAADQVELSVPRPAHRRVPGCIVHRPVLLPASAITEHRGVAVTTPARTLVDITSRLTSALLSRTVDEGLISGLWSVRELTREAAVSSGRAGVDRLRRVLAAREDGSAAAGREPLERRVARVLRCFAPFEIQHQVVVGGHVYVLDLAFPERLVAVECDGWDVRRRSRSKFDHERRRDNLLVAAGWTIVRLTSAMSDDEMRSAVHSVLLRSSPFSR